MAKWQAKFQHHELVGKRDKVEALQKAMEQDAKVHELAVRTGNEKLRQLRERLAQDDENHHHKSKSNNKNHTTMSTETAHTLLEIEMDDVDSDRLWKDWPRIVEQKADAIQTNAAHMRHSNEELVRILEGYQKQYGLVVDNDTALGAMQRLAAAPDDGDDQGGDQTAGRMEQ